MRVLVTGANGFVGASTTARFRAEGHEVVPVVRDRPKPNEIAIGDIHGATPWLDAVRGCDAVIHTAARVHQMHEHGMQGLDEFRKANVDGTLRLAKVAAESGVRRFVFLSSVKVNGERGRFAADDECFPQDAYGLSKKEAELGLIELAARTGLEVVILRLPLVYGPGVRANFRRLVALVQKGLPLPLGMAANQRSLIYLENLTSAIVACATHPAAVGKTYMVSDGEDVSTAELIRRIARSLGCSSYLFSVPPAVLLAIATLVGKRGVADRLLGSLVVDSRPIRDDLGWQPPCSLNEGLKHTADWFLHDGLSWQ